MDDFQNPIIQQNELIYQLVDIKIFKELDVFFKKVEILAESGMFFSAININSDFMKDKVSNDFNLRASDEMLMSSIVIYASHEKLQHNRRYQTLSELLASLSGTANFFMFFCNKFSKLFDYDVNHFKFIV